MGDVLGFFAGPGPLTSDRCHGALLNSLPRGLDELVGAIQGLAIYDVVAPDFYGVEVPDGRADEIHCRGIEDMLAGIIALDDSPLASARPAERRLFSRCAGFTRLLVSALRAQRIPARSRCGFASYFRPGYFEDHWVAEVWDAGEDRWRLVDAQLDAVWRSRIGFRGDPLDVERDSFLVAADAWMHCRAGDEEPARFGISFADLYGLWFVAGNLIRDLAALNKMEMLPWDTWAAHPAPGEPIADDQLAFFDQLAAVTSDPDSHLDELRRLYESHDRLQVPAEVFNALRQRHEAVA